MPDAQGRMTNYDYAAIQRQEPEVPDFRFSDYQGHRPAFRGFFEWPDEGPPEPDHPFAHSSHIVHRPGGDELWLDNHVRQPEPGKADPTWDQHFELKFSKAPDPDAPLVTPRGFINVLQKFEDPILEANYFAETQCCVYHAQGGTDTEHQGNVKDIATDWATFKANGIDQQDMSVLDPSDGAPAQYCVRIKDEEMTDDDGNVYQVPRYANMNYIVNMVRRIDWEKFISQCGPLERIRFEPDDDGDLAITYYGKAKDPNDILAIKRRLRDSWLAVYGELPDPKDCTRKPDWKDLGHIAPLLGRLTDEQRDQYLNSKMHGTEDDDPGRYEFHADIDPEPMRWQYPYGRCGWRCATVPWVDPIDKSHNLCSIDGNDLYHDDHDRWLSRQPEADVGYAGPKGYLGTDVDEVDHGPDDEMNDTD